MLQQTAFQNTAQKNANNQLVQQALSQLGGLTTNLASNYNPASYNSATQNALQNALSGVGQNTNTGLAGINSAGNLANTLNETSSNSLVNLLKASLVGAGTNALTQKDSSGNSLLTKLLGLLGGGSNGRDPDLDLQALTDFLQNTPIDSPDYNTETLRKILIKDPGVPDVRGPV